MKRNNISLVLGLLLVASMFLSAGVNGLGGTAMAASPGPQAGPDGVTRFLTGPNEGDPLDIALTYIRQNRDAWGLTDDDLADLVVTGRYTTRHNGVTHLYLRQRLNGIEVFGSEVNVNISKDGAIINLGGEFIPHLSAAANARTPVLSPEKAVRRAARHLDLDLTEPLEVRERVDGPDRRVTFSGGGISRDDIPVRLMYQAVKGGGLRLVWSMVLRVPDNQHWWYMHVDAVTGEVLLQHDWIIHESPTTAEVAQVAEAPVMVAPPPASTTTTRAPQARPAAADSYRVFPLPYESPEDPGASHTLVTEPADPVASPYGWHDADGAPGAEYTDTRGNNVFAQEDTDANDWGGSRPSGGPSLVFDYAWDPALGPAEGTNQQAAIVNLFYWNNIAHDVFYHYGFDEASGNFQVNNYGRGGVGGDPVIADAQDGSGVNNASFGVGPDGIPPRMQMFIWLPPATHLVTVNSPPNIAGDYPAGGAQFGPPLDTVGITGDVVLANDGTGTATDACEPLINTGQVAGKIALVDRGNCYFVTKVKNAQNAGATGVIVVNNQGDQIITMGGNDPTITIPSVFIGQTDGNTIKGELATGVNATIKAAGDTIPARDSDFDSGVIIHEYGHGISVRLTGGPGNASCLFNDEQMGEGWSDFLALALTAKPGDQGTDSRPVGSYLLFESPPGNGIRQYPYSTDMTINPHTYDDIKTAAIPHGVGEVWATMLWDMYWKLVDAYGFDPDVYNGNGGNNLAIQLVIDGMKLQRCLPHFVDGRDAILLADQINNGGANECLIWEAFAHRGLGYSARAGSRWSVTDGTEAFDLPPACGGTGLSISVYTDKESYTVGEVQTFGLDLTNPGAEQTVRFLLLLSTPWGQIIPVANQNVTLPAGFNYSNPTLFQWTLPPIPNGTYTWVGALVPMGGAPVVDYAVWVLTSSTTGAETEPASVSPDATKVDLTPFTADRGLAEKPMSVQDLLSELERVDPTRLLRGQNQRFKLYLPWMPR